jgi:shikimate kinase
MGAGKSSVGRTAASILRMPFVDTDGLVENATGRTIPRIFEELGEEAFRTAEALAIQRLLIIPDSVIATGGGAVVRPGNWDYLLAAGLVIRLYVTPEESLRRTAHDTSRPLLQGEDRLARLRRLHEEREAFYARAHHTIESEAMTVQEVARRSVELYSKWRAKE